MILLASLKAVADAVGVSNWGLLTLASTEVLAVILFVFENWRKAAGMDLMGIFGTAITLATLSGVILDNLQLIIYLACTYFIVVHSNNSNNTHY